MIIIGLGNPGPEYRHTRHNVGFMVVDQLAEKLGSSRWKNERGVAWSKIGDLLLIKPQEYMNVSGPTIKRFLENKKIDVGDPTQLMVIHDDLDFPLGEVHEQQDRSAGGHNGVQSIIDAFGTQKFSRLRLGIGNNRDLNIPAEDYVLQKFSVQEASIIDQAVNNAVNRLAESLNK